MRGAVQTGLLLLAGLVVTLACAEAAPDPAAVRLAALSAAAAVDTLDDLGAVSDPEAPGVREDFRASTLRALEHAQAAHRAAPKQTRYAQNLSLEAARATDQFGDALAAALEAIGRLDALTDDFDRAVGRFKPRTWDERLRLTKSLLGPAFETALAAAVYRSRELATLGRELDALGALGEDWEDWAKRHDAEAHELESDLLRQLPASAAQLAIDTVATLWEGWNLQKELQDLIQTAEDARHHAISTHRSAAEAWRRLETP